jgi:hypothetical protein
MKTLRCLALPLLLAALPAARCTVPAPGPVDDSSLPPRLAPAPAQPPANPRANATRDTGAQAAAAAKATPALPVPAQAPEPAPASAPAAVKSTTKAPPNATTKPSVAPPTLSPRFQLIRSRIAELLQNRGATPASPDLRYNPFRPIGAGSPVPGRSSSAGSETASPGSPGSDLIVLQQAVATLKVRGVVEKDGRSLLTINAGPNKDGTYKEGDVLTVIVQNEPVHLRVRQITHYSVMFSLNDAEFTLKF